MPPSSSNPSIARITSPKGTRDLYPEDALKRRYLEQSWRDASIRCGFEEIHGPTFETTDLYAVKSGEGILGELFQAYSGKAPEEVAQVQETGRAPYAMRPEFTPTLARMFAAKAGSLPRPCKWFTGGPYFRAERPQRGRLREFLQWNVDVIGDDGTPQGRSQADAECVGCCVTLLDDLGFSDGLLRTKIGDRSIIEGIVRLYGAPDQNIESVLSILDRVQGGKISRETAWSELVAVGIPEQKQEQWNEHLLKPWEPIRFSDENVKLSLQQGNDVHDGYATLYKMLQQYRAELWCEVDLSIVRGLAYYTGTVFEVLADGERAVAGGGRYDKLIELMGGPPTPAVGFAMGDVVVSLLLEDKGLMPQGAELMEAVSRHPASVRPEVFVVGADDEQSDGLVRRLAADLRRGVESKAYQDAGQRRPWSVARYDGASGGVRPLHARVSYKSTRNLKKLLADGEKQHARLAAIIHGPDRVQLKDFDARRDLTPKDLGLSDTHAEFSIDPASPVYIGRAADRML